VRLEGEIFEIITVRQLPPIESFNKRVSLEFRYGMYLDPSANALMQFPKKMLLVLKAAWMTWNN
jgi:hypothetical protein